jgi:hypothetical protein
MYSAALREFSTLALLYSTVPDDGAEPIVKDRGLSFTPLRFVDVDRDARPSRDAVSITFA